MHYITKGGGRIDTDLHECPTKIPVQLCELLPMCSWFKEEKMFSNSELDKQIALALRTASGL